MRYTADPISSDIQREIFTRLSTFSRACILRDCWHSSCVTAPQQSLHKGPDVGRILQNPDDVRQKVAPRWGETMAGGKARVSLCMIVRDEEQNLAECLTPVAELFDEIVIVDTGSRDKTKEIARNFTPHVHDFPWCDDFSAARNESLKHATGDWVFWLDADDRVRPEHVSRLRAVLSELDDTPRMLMMDTVLVAAEVTDEPRQVTHRRLFRRHPLLHWQGRVHEQLAPEPASLGYEEMHADVQIEHVGYTNKAVSERKLRRKLRLLQMDYAVNPDNPNTLLHLGMSLCNVRNTKESRKHLQRLVATGDRGAPYLRWAYSLLCQLSLTDGNPTEAALIAQKGLAQFPDDESLGLSLALAHYAREDYAATSRALETIIDSQPTRHMMYATPANIRQKVAPGMLGSVRRMQGKFAEAESLMQGVLHAFPADVITWYNLGLTYLDQCDGARLAPVIKRLLTLPKGNVQAGLLAALWHLRHGNPALAGPIIDDLISQVPQAAHPRMLRAEWLSRCGYPMEAQMRALRDVLRLQPSNIEARRWLELAERVQGSPALGAVAPSAAAALMSAPAQAV
jgi:tetratricopeptide (TPR) repeat protein